MYVYVYICIIYTYTHIHIHTPARMQAGRHARMHSEFIPVGNLLFVSICVLLLLDTGLPKLVFHTVAVTVAFAFGTHTQRDKTKRM